MILSMSGQAALFMITVLVGLFIGFVYDVFRILRKTVKHANFMIQLEDALYWIFVTFVAFYVMLYQNQGEIRLFNFIGIFLGMGLYFITLSFFVIKVSVSVINLFKRILFTTLKVLFFPVKVLLRLLCVPCRLLKNVALSLFAPARKALRKSGKYAKMKGMKTWRDVKIILKKV